MSSTNSTPNYNLSQWVNTDYVMMSDFNRDNLAIDTALAGKANIAFGSYVGNGTGGASAPKSLSFSFEPSVVLVTGPAGTGSEKHEASVVLIRNNTAAGYTVEKDGAAKSIELACSWDGSNVSFNSLSAGASAALEQFNAQGESYFYAAF